MTAIFEIFKAIILGIVEGITEWLPISSTGHLIIIDELIGGLISDDFSEMFNVVIQLGAILAVVWLYFHKLNPFARDKSEDEKNNTIALWIKVIIACIPAGVIGILFDDLIDQYLYRPMVVAVALIVYGIAFIVIENINKNKKPRFRNLDRLPLSVAVGIGLFQVLAMLVPGTSRSGATILGGLILGTSRFVATEFTFFLAIPVMFGASLLKLFKFGMPSIFEFMVLVIGMAVSYIVSVLSIKFLMSYIKKNNFKIFGYYRILLGVIVIIYFMIR